MKGNFNQTIDEIEKIIDRNQAQKRKKMKVSGKSVFQLKKTITNKNKRRPKQTS